MTCTAHNPNDRNAAARRRVPEPQRIDALYRDMDAALPGMCRYVDKAESRHRWRHHRYDLSGFGLDHRAVRGRFERYASAFDLHTQAAKREVDPVTQGTREALA
ncbi:MAG: hypothetical protein P8Y48_07965 [Novosphingobium sp.]